MKIILLAIIVMASSFCVSAQTYTISVRMDQIGLTKTGKNFSNDSFLYNKKYQYIHYYPAPNFELAHTEKRKHTVLKEVVVNLLAGVLVSYEIYKNPSHLR